MDEIPSKPVRCHMDYATLRRELLLHLRGELAQSQVNKKLGVTFNKIYRWESGTDHLAWPDFVKLCKTLHIPLNQIFAETLTYHDDPANSKLVVKHFLSGSTQSELSKILGISRYTLSRWIKGESHPTLEQVFLLMDHATPDFLRFLEMITGGAILPSTSERIRQYRSQMQHYFAYPWMSILLSAIETTPYRKNPCDEVLAKKTKLPIEDIQRALKDFSASGIIEWKEDHWETRLNRIAVKATAEDLLKMARYVFQTALQSVDSAPKNTHMRLSWKMFSLNKNSYEKILQRYTEFFHDLGKIIDAGQKDADRVYLFAAAVIDYDNLK